MFKNYFKVAIKSLLNQKLSSFINILGLTLGIAANLFIALYIFDETSFDTFHKNYERIFRLESVFYAENNVDHWASSPGILKELIDEHFPEIEASARLVKQPEQVIEVDETKFKEKNVFFVDSAITNVLGLSFIRGNSKEAFSDPNSIVLSEKMAKRFYGTTDVIGKTIPIFESPRTIKGVIKDFDKNSHMTLDILLSIDILKRFNQKMFQDWTNLGFYTYVKTTPGVNLKQTEERLKAACYEMGAFEDPDYYHPTLHAINGIHLDGNAQYELSNNSYWIYIYIFLFSGILIIVLASINYINLTTANSMNRAKEIGIRKTLGADKSDLVKQFLVESVLVTFIAFVVAFVIVYISLPAFNHLTGKELTVTSFANANFILTAIGIVLAIGFLAGLYPAFVLSSFRPTEVLKGVVMGNTLRTKFSFGLRKGLMILQFVISIFLLIASMVVVDQIAYMFNKPLGFNQENVLVLPTNISATQLNAMQEELKRDGVVEGIAFTSAVPGVAPNRGAFIVEGHDYTVFPHFLDVDYNYLATMGMKIVQGRDFDKHIKADENTAFIINETAARSYGWEDPIGKKLEYSYYDKTKVGKVVGVVQDFNQESQHKAIEPLILQVHPEGDGYIVVRYNNKAKITEVKAMIAAAWDRFLPNDVFTVSLLKNDLHSLYKAEGTMKQLLLLFSLLAIVISSLGLFALVTFSTQLRKKEIGIRKTLGASNRNIVYILSKDYFLPIGVAILVALPLSYFGLNAWLSRFAYHVGINALTLIIAVLIAALTAFLTLSTQGLKAALNNPVKALRD
jgi:putative ABC transport system permease protein